MENEVILGNVMVDCDDEKKLQKFYGELLGWEMCELFARPAVRSSTGIVFLFIEEAEYICPVWPEETGKQQKQIHFDFQVDNVMEMVKKAERLGATKSKAQFGGSDFVTTQQDIHFAYAKSNKVQFIASPTNTFLESVIVGYTV